MFSIFDKYSNLVIALSKKKDGSMKFSCDFLRGMSPRQIWRGDKEIFENRKKFLAKLGININQVVSADLVHGNVVQVVTAKNRRQRIAETDGLLTNDKDTFLAITVADCLPIFLYDTENKVIGLIHGGWQSLAKDILASAIKKLIDNFGSRPENILAGIGPGIGACHFEIKEDILKHWKVRPSKRAFRQEDGKVFLDLKITTKIQLVNLGLKEENIEINPECTYCLADKYFSYRREIPPNLVGKTKILKAMMAVIGQR